MKLTGFIGAAYKLDSVNVDAQRCVNLVPEIIESGRGKEAQVAYLRGTEGLKKILAVGDGPIRCIHTDSIGRVFVVSGNKLYLLSTKVNSRFAFDPVVYTAIYVSDVTASVDTSTDKISYTSHGLVTGVKTQVVTTDTLPTPLVAATDYWVIKNDGDTFQLASSLANAIAGTAIDLTAQGAGEMKIDVQNASKVSNVYFKNINFDTNTISKNAHGLYDGCEVKILSSGLIPRGFVRDTSFFVTNSTTNSFQLAESLSDASDGTEVTLTDVTDSWTKTLIGADGEYGGDTVLFSTSKGLVRAASMSFGGDGDDSSTVFVDGVQNYLYLDDDADYSFGILGSLTSATATFDLTNDIVISIGEGFHDYVDKEIQIRAGIDADALGVDTDASIQFIKDDLDPVITIVLTVQAAGSVSTAELVEYINTGGIDGKTTLAPIDDDNVRSLIIASGGGTEDILDELPNSDGDTKFLNETFSTSTDEDFGYGTVPTATQIDWSDSRFILNEFGTNKFWVSDLQSFNVDTLSFASSEGDPDVLVALAVNNRLLYAFNELTTEVYADTGNADFPFERIAGGFLEVGIRAEASLAKINGTLCWLGQSKDGKDIIYAMSGMNYQRISTHAIEQAIRGYADPSKATAFAYQDGGHFYYVLNFTEATWVYDFSTKLWHERAYSNSGVLERHRAETHTYAIKQGIHLVGDYSNNKVYQFDSDTYDDDGNEIVRLRSAPHMSAGLNELFCHRFQLDMETGVGLDSGQGSDPQVILQFSKDGGHTFSDEQWTSAGGKVGGIGDYKKRVAWRRLGRGRDWVFRVKISDPVKVRMIDAQIDVEQGVS